MRLSGRPLMLGGVAIAILMLLTLVMAPHNSQYNSGSTYGRAPDGYGAWYAYMEARGATIQRWRKPLRDLIGAEASRETAPVQTPATLLRIIPNRANTRLAGGLTDWIQQGNTFVLLGADSGVTEAAFTTWQESEVGEVKIDTSRRRVNLELAADILLGDRFGAVVWRTEIGKGQAIWATTPYLGANAYQDQSGNYAFLAQLVEQADQAIWADEYIHGYKDADTLAAEEGIETWRDYLAKTPWLIVLAQVSMLLLIAIWGQNRRFGSPMSLKHPPINNSEAYIQALAQVLRKAGSQQFVVDVVGKAERLHLQKGLGFGSIPVDEAALLEAWVSKTGRPAAELKQILHFNAQKRSIYEQDLLTWLQKIQSVRQQW